MSVAELYEENYSHLDFIENMNGGECECAIHMEIQRLQREGK